MFVATETVAKICDELEFGVGDSLEFTKDWGGNQSGSKNKGERGFYGGGFMESCG